MPGAGVRNERIARGALNGSDPGGICSARLGRTRAAVGLDRQ